MFPLPPGMSRGEFLWQLGRIPPSEVAYAAAGGIFIDGFESGDTMAWSSQSPGRASH